MADRYWIASSAGNWNDTANWSTSSGGSGGASVPGSGDIAHFDGNGLGDCRLNVSIDVDGIAATSDYTGEIDGDSDNLDHTIGASGLQAANTDIDLHMGSGTWTCSGDWDPRNSANLDAGTSTLVLTGSNKDLGSQDGPPDYYNITIDSGASYTINFTLAFSGDLTVSGTLTQNAGVLSNSGNGTLTIGASGELTDTGGSFDSQNGTTLSIVNNGTITIGTFNALSTGSATISGSGTFASGTNTILRINSGGTYTIQSDLTFTGPVEFRNSFQSGTLDNSGNHNLTFKGDVTVTESGGGLTWTVGTGTITLSGSANQSIDFNGQSVEDIDVDKTGGTATLTGAVDPDSLTVTAGTFDIDGNDMSLTGDLTQAVGTTVQDTTGGGTITVGGNFAINGTSGSNCTWNGPDLTITGTADADWTTVSNSDASGGTEVNATDDCTDNGGNTNWNFGVAATFSPYWTRRTPPVGAGLGAG